MVKIKKRTFAILKPQEVHIQELCDRILGFTVRQYNKLAKEGYLPIPQKGMVDLLEACQMIVAYYRTILTERGGNFQHGNLTDEKKRLTKLQADRVEFKLEVEKGEYLRTDICMMLWGKMIQGCRAKLLSLPLKFSPLLVSLKTMNEIKDKLESGIYEALNELADMDLKALLNQTGIEQDSGSPDVGGDKKDLPAANKKKSKRVGRRGKAVKPGKQRGTRKMV